jgi:hypothetical protein
VAFDSTYFGGTPLTILANPKVKDPMRAGSGGSNCRPAVAAMRRHQRQHRRIHLDRLLSVKSKALQSNGPFADALRDDSHLRPRRNQFTRP